MTLIAPRHGLGSDLVMRFICIVVVLVSTAASAQDVNFDPLVLRQCLIGADDPQTCAGQMAEACVMATPHHPELFKEDLCAIVEGLEWEAYVADVASKIIAASKEADAGAKGWTANLPKQSETFVRAQDNWTAHRDASCAYEGARLGGDDRRRVTESLCRLRMNSERFVTLQEFREALQ